MLTGLTQSDGRPRGQVKLALFIVFLCFYVVYCIMSLILLLNLLIGTPHCASPTLGYSLHACR